MKLMTTEEQASSYDEGTICAGFLHPGDVRGEMAASLFVSGKEIPQLVGLAVRQSGPRLAAARNRIVREFLQSTRFEWLLFIDSDMFWKVDDLRKLINTADAVERPVVGGLCFADQNGQLFPTIYMLDKNTGSYHVALDYPQDKAFPVDGTGAAFIMIHRRVLERVGAAYTEPTPWFADTIVNGEERGEDLTFCQRVRELGYPIYIDARVKVGHVKQRYLTEDEWLRQRELQRFLIVGTGRSGTGFMSRFFSYLHTPCGHEETFNPKRIGQAGGKNPPWSPHRGEASWMAVPFMDQWEVPTAHIVRNPLEVIRSMVGIKWLDKSGLHGDYEQIALQVMEQIGIDEIKDWEETDDRDELIHRACVFLACWTQLIANHGHPWWRVEDVRDDEDVAAEVYAHLTGNEMDRSKVRASLQKIANEGPVNSRPRQEDITWDDLPPSILELAEHYGYETDTGNAGE